MGPEFPGEGAIHKICSRVFSQIRFWQHTKKMKNGSEICSCNTQKNLENGNLVLVWNLKLLLPTQGGRVEIGLPCITSETGGPLKEVTINYQRSSVQFSITVNLAEKICISPAK